jgi:hypothetical protein
VRTRRRMLRAKSRLPAARIYASIDFQDPSQAPQRQLANQRLIMPKVQPAAASARRAVAEIDWQRERPTETRPTSGLPKGRAGHAGM